MSSSSSLTNIPALIGGFTAVSVLAVGAYFVPRLLKACAEYQQRRRNGFTAQEHSNRCPPIPLRHNVPPLSLQDVELNTISVIHITNSQMGNGHQKSEIGEVEQEVREEAAWEVGQAV